MYDSIRPYYYAYKDRWGRLITVGDITHKMRTKYSWSLLLLLFFLLFASAGSFYGYYKSHAIAIESVTKSEILEEKLQSIKCDSINIAAVVEVMKINDRFGENLSGIFLSFGIFNALMALLAVRIIIDVSRKNAK